MYGLGRWGMATQLTTTRQVFDHHIRALMSGDLEGIVSDYGDHSVLIGPDGVVRGLKAIRETFAGYLATLFRPGTYKLEADTVHVDGEIAFVVWHAHCQAADITFAADTFVIRDGKIAVQTFAPKVEPHS